MQHLSADCIEQREPVRPQREPYRFADLDRFVRRQSRLYLAAAGYHRNDLRRAEIFGANDTASQRRGIGERHILGPHTEGEPALGTILEQLWHFDGHAVNPDAAIAPLQRGLNAEKVHWRCADK